MADNLCPKCNGSMDTGRVNAGEELRYVSDRQKGTFRQVTPINRARVCLNCGYVEHYLNPAELLKKIQP